MRNHVCGNIETCSCSVGPGGNAYTCDTSPSLLIHLQIKTLKRVLISELDDREKGH